MSRDYAKSKTKKPVRKAPRAKTQSNGGNGVKLYFAGVLSGVFISFLAYLTTLQPTSAPEQPVSAGEQVQEQAPKPRFDFYTLLPEQTMEVEVDVEDIEPARDLGGPASTTNKAQQYVLQAGSFRQRADADRRRAELLLLGLEPSIQESTGDNGRWFRVYLGPYGSNSAMSRARALTAGQDIDTLLLKRKSPR